MSHKTLISQQTMISKAKEIIESSAEFEHFKEGQKLKKDSTERKTSSAEKFKELITHSYRQPKSTFRPKSINNSSRDKRFNLSPRIEKSQSKASTKPPLPSAKAVRKRMKKTKIDYIKQLRELEDKVLKEKRRDEQKRREIEENAK